MVTSTYRVDADLKKQAAELYESLGMNLNTAINVFLRQSVREQRMPFTPSAAVTLPAVGTTSENGITYKGVDEQGYPMVDIPESIVYQPRHAEDGTLMLPKEWRD